MTDSFDLSSIKLSNGYSLDKLQSLVSISIGNGNDSTVLFAELCLFIGIEDDKHKENANRFIKSFKVNSDSV